MQTEFLTLTSSQVSKYMVKVHDGQIFVEQVCFLSTWKFPSSRTNHVENCQTKRQDFLFFYIHTKLSKNQIVGKGGLQKLLSGFFPYPPFKEKNPRSSF